MPDPVLHQVIDFFCGCGGMSWGFANTRQSHHAFKVLGGIDIDASALETYRANIGARSIRFDIRKLAQQPEVLHDLFPELNESSASRVFVGCPPCQGFSAHRKKDNRDDPRNDLISAFTDVVLFHMPEVFVIENVPEILDGKFSAYYSRELQRLARRGYHITKDVLDVSRYGVPQRRRRAIVIGSRIGRIQLPEPILNRDEALTVRDAIAHLKPLASGETDPEDENHRSPKHTERILTRIRKTPPDGGDRRSLTDQLTCHAAIDLGDTPGFTDVYGRLRWDVPSITITAKSSTPSCGRFLHPEQHRNISVREAAILQSFPHDFRFRGPLTQQYRHIGEAVPPLFARHVAFAVLDHFQGGRPTKKDYKSSAPTSIKVVDCFSGAGGLALGFAAAGFETSFAFDADADAVATFRNNVSGNSIQADIRNEHHIVTEIERAVGDAAYILVGGPPCQGFSQQRRGEDRDVRNDLAVEFAALVMKLKQKPLAVVLENVTYLDSPRGKHALRRITKLLSSAGFELRRHDLNSADFGIPQLRKRIVIVALNPDIAKRYAGPIATTPDRWPTVGECLRGLPSPGARSLLHAMVTNHETAEEGPLNVRRISYVDMGGGRLAIPASLQLPCHKRYGGHLDVYGRLDWFSQARTITGGFDSFTRGEYAHPLRHRSITAREAARLQGFPDWFVFAGNRAAVRRQIGNAVPPALAFAIALAVRQALDGVEVIDGEANQLLHVR